MKKTLLIYLTIIGFTVSAQNAINFDGIDDVVQTNFVGVNGNFARTVEAWIKTTVISDPNSAGTQKVIADWGTMVNSQRFTFNLLWANAIRLEVGGNGLSGTIPVNDGQWHHVAVVYDPIATNTVSLYVDGSLDVSGNLTVPVTTQASVNMRIGKRIDNTGLFDGTIDEVRVWNKALTLTEIANNRNAEFCSIPAGLVAYYTFNQNLAGGNNSGNNKLFDAVNGKDGTLTGFALSGSSSNWVAGANLTPGLSCSRINQTGGCDSVLSPSGNYWWYSTGVYTDTFVNANSCDSLINVNLSLGKTSQVNFVYKSCGPYTSVGGKTYTTSGTYFDTIINPISGCNIIVEQELDITIIDSTVTRSGSNLSSNHNNADKYKWLDCADNYTAIGGATSQTYSATKDGEYAVEVTMNDCIDTSGCISIVNIGINDLSNELNVSIYPNPVNNQFQIDFGILIEEGQIEVSSVAGELVYSSAISNAKNHIVNLDKFVSGVYFVKVTTPENTGFYKVIKN